METRSFPPSTLPTRYRSAIAAVAIALLPMMVSAQTQKRSKSVALAKSGGSDERTMKGGDTQSYQIKLKAGEYCVIAVTQSAIDLIATIDSPAGGRLADVDTPHRQISVFTPASDTYIKDAATPWRSGLGVGVSKAQPGFDPLPDVADELRGIIKDPSAGGGGVLKGRLLLDEAFTESALRTELGQEPPIVHVASHFQFWPGNEADSFLLLGDGRRLSVGELKTSWNFFKGVDLLTLSACETAVGGPGANGREVESFGVFAQRNGAKAVVATLWPAADSSTRVLMEHFYRGRTQSKAISKAEALQAAQLALLRGDRAAAGTDALARRSKQSTATPPGEGGTPYAHPFYWAPFVLIGNWR